MTIHTRKIGLFPATMLVAGNMIGAGIFSDADDHGQHRRHRDAGLARHGAGRVHHGLPVCAARPNPAEGRRALRLCSREPGRFRGFQCNLLYWFSNVIANIAIATSITGYLTVFVPALRNPHLGACSTVLMIWLSAVV